MNRSLTHNLAVFFSILFLILIYKNGVSQNTIYGGKVSGNWTMDNSPYYIDGEIFVSEGESLQIDPGVEVKFNGNYRLTIAGQLIAIGTVEDSILFTATDTTGFYNNMHSGWHGICFMEPSPIDDSSRIEHCILTYGKADGSDEAGKGGALFIKNCTTLSVKNSRFEFNTAQSGGAIACIENSNVIVENNTFKNNSTSYSGGAIYSSESNLILSHNLISKNRSINERSSNGDGGGVYLYKSSHIFNNNVIVNNTSYEGGAIYVNRSDNLTLYNNTIAGNEANRTNGIYCSNSAIHITNTILFNGGGNNEVYNSYGSSIIVEHCNYSDPLFVDLENDNVNLTWDNFPLNDVTKSPCIDAGDPLKEHDADGTIKDIGAKQYHQSADAAPIAYFTQNAIQGIAPFSVEFTDFSSQAVGEIASWFWTFGEESSSSVQHPTHVFNNDGEFDVKLLVTNQQGKKDSLLKTNLITVIKGTIIDTSIVSGTWLKQNSPYNIYNDIRILNGETLTIEPGVIVKFYGNYKLDVQGQLLAVGTQSDSITFTRFKEGDEWHSIRFYGTEATNDSSKLEYCILEHAKYYSGDVRFNGGNALFAKDFDKISIKNSLLQNNYGGRGAGVYCDNANINIVNNTIQNNSTNQYGAGINVYNCSPLIQGNTIQNNYANDNGGGIYCKLSSSEISSNKIIDNSSYRSGAGVYCSESDVMLSNNLIANNLSKSYDGGGIAIYSCSPTLVNNTICFNRADDGEGLYIYGASKPQFYNTVVFSNGGRYTPYNSNNEIYLDSDNADPDFYNCNLQGGIEGIIVNYGSYTGNYKNIFDGSPMFRDTINKDYQLTNLSRCINLGNDSIANVYLTPFDLNGETRIFDGAIDVGAYEFQSIIENRRPIITSTEDLEFKISETRTMEVAFFDPDMQDTHTFQVNSSNINVTANKITASNEGFTFDLSASPDWKGTSDIIVSVTDNSGAANAIAKDTFSIVVDNFIFGVIDSSTTWQDTIWVNADIIIADSVNLIIKPGTKIFFAERCKMIVKGSVKALGNSSDSILFSAIDTHKGWGGIRYDNSNGLMSNTNGSEFSHCIFSHTLSTEGNYIENYGVFKISYYSNIAIRNSLFTNNLAEYEPAMYCYYSDIKVVNNVFRNNTSERSSINRFYQSDVIFNNNLLRGNIINTNIQYSSNSLLYLYYSDGVFCNNTVSKNSLSGGKAVYIRSGVPSFINNIIYFNTGYYQSPVYINTGTQPIFSNNLIEGETLSLNDSSITVDPLFVDPDNFDFSLQGRSYAINTGAADTNGWYIPANDLSDNLRVFGSKIDLGAFEYQQVSQNRLPVVQGINDQFCKISAQKTIEVNFNDYDNETLFIAEITSNTAAVQSANITITGGKLLFDLIPDTGWSDTARIEVSIKDGGNSIGDINTIEFNFIVSNSLYVCGELQGDVLWDVDTVFINCNVFVPNNASLTIVPGTVVAFNGEYRLQIDGKINAVGLPEDSIYFTRAYEENETLAANDYIYLNGNALDSSYFAYCIFDYGNIYNSYYNDSRGKVYINNYGYVNFSNCLFSSKFQNSAKAIYANYSSIEVDKCTFLKNGIQGISRGGAINCYNSTAKITNSIFSNNHSQLGGALYLYHTPATIINSLFIGNIATTSGGALYNSSSNVTIINSTIVKNQAAAGGGLYYYTDYYSTAPENIVNSIIYNNDTLANEQIYTRQNIQLSHCAVQGGVASINNAAGTINSSFVFDSFPYFKNSENGDFSLTDSSFCIDAGTTDSSIYINMPEIDLASHPRIFNAKQVDMGAYEFQGNPTNRKPIIKGLQDMQTAVNTPFVFTFEVIDFDSENTLSINLLSDTENVNIVQLSDSVASFTTIYTYQLVPLNDWEGIATIQVNVNDNSGEANAVSSDNFKFDVSRIVCGEIKKDTTWSGKVKVNCDIFIPDTVTLTIEAGSIIEFQGPYKIEIEGFVNAIGTRADTILFTALDTLEGWRGLQFTNNIYYYPAPTDTSFLRYCNFEFGNATGSTSADRNGGAISISQYNYKLKIENCGFFNNHSDYYGGALYVYGSAPEINNNVFVNNSAANNGGGMYLRSCYSPLLMNNYFAFCKKSIAVEDSDIEMANFTLSNNTIHLDIEDSDVKFTNCIFWNDSIAPGYFSLDLYYRDTIKFTSCNIQDRSNLFYGYYKEEQLLMTNNLNYNPVFTTNSYQLSSASPLLNLGSGMYDTLNLHDINGMPRIYSGNNAAIDLGAFEFQGEPTNRTPIIETFDMQRSIVSASVEIPINFSDFDVADAHSIKVESNDLNVAVVRIDGNTSGSVVTLQPNAGWFGNAIIRITVTDDSGEENASDSTEFTLRVSNEACGTIRGNTTWDFPFIKVTCNVIVDTNATLTIKPGTYIEFQGTNKLEVYGNIIAEGAPEDSIVFTVPYAERNTGWRGIRFFGPGKGSSVFSHCIVEYVKASTSYPESKYGALTFEDQNSFVVINSRISNNYGSDYGGGIQSINSDGKITSNNIFNNKFVTNGGAIYSNGSYLRIDNNIIANNECNGEGGAIYSRFDSLIVVKNNEILNNKANSSGGGIYVNNSKSKIINNNISYNKARNEGGGIKIIGNADIINNLISYNSSTNGDNYAVRGGGMKLDHANVKVTNNTFAFNHFTGAELSTSIVEFTNNIFYGHYTTGDKPSNVYIDDDYNDDPSEVVFRNCLIEAGAISLGSFYYPWEENDARLLNCLDSLPMFLDAENNNFALNFNSPAYNKGTIDTTGLLLPEFDLRGNDRIIDDTLDIGAYEFNHTIDNRIPKIASIPYYAIRQGASLAIEVFFTDADEDDTHQISVLSGNANVAISELSGSSFTIIPASDFMGEVTVSIQVIDNSQADNSIALLEFKVFVGDNYEVNTYEIDHDFVWRTQTVKIFNNIRLNENKVLKIDPGTTIELQGDYKLDIKGQLLAKGNEAEFVVFKMNENNLDLKWQGIYFEYNIHQSNNPPKEISELHFCKIENAKTALYLKHLDDIQVTSCVIANNERGIFIEGGATIENCKIFNNSTYLDGGGIYARGYYGDKIVRIYNNEIYGNHSDRDGGGLYLHGDKVILLGNIIHHNTAINGGGIYMESSNILIINNTIANNFASTGGGLWTTNSKNIFANNIFQYNHTSLSNKEIFISYNGSNLILYNNYINGGLDSAVSVGNYFEGESRTNFESNSVFTDTTQNDYSLAATSICINSGLMNPELMFRLDTTAISRLNIVENIDVGAIEFEGSHENRLPIITRIDNLSMRTDTISNMKVSYNEYDLNDKITATIEFGNSNLTYSNLLIEEKSISFDIEALDNWSGNTNITVTILDSSETIGLSNQKIYQVTVSNTYEVCGEITENTIWDADTVKINCDVEVHHSAKLTILPGTKILFQGSYRLTINGIINAIGTEGDSILFTRSDSTWAGLSINPQFQYSALVGDTSRMEYCIFENTNTLSNYGTEAAVNINRSECILSNSRISNNLTAGILVAGNAIINDNLISKNKLGIRVYSSPIIENNIIEDNERVGYFGAGIVCYHGSSPFIINNVIRFNKGGGILGGVYGNTSLTIINNIIHDNIPFNGEGGGGIYINQMFAPSTIIGNLIYNNHSTENGGGILIGYNNMYDPNLIYNNTIVNNTSDEKGGGIYISRLSNNIMKNNIIWGNKAQGVKNQIDAYSSSSNSPIVNCLLEGGIDNIPIRIDSILNIFTFDPGFLDTAQNDFSLSSSSSAINKGVIDTVGLGIPKFDIVGNPRVFNDTIDLGALEFSNCLYIDTSITESICEGEVITIGETSFYEQGEYSIILNTHEGCDSIVNLSLTVNPVYNEADVATICQGEIFSLGSQNLTETGEYIETFHSISGCDSIVTLTLIVNPTYNEAVDASICEGETYTLGTQTLSLAGEYPEVFESAFGCDSIVVLTLIVNSVETGVIQEGPHLTAQATKAHYQWATCGESLVILEGESNQTFTATENGKYAVIVTQNTCVDTSSCYAINGISILRNDFDSEFDIYPNPTEGFITIDTKIAFDEMQVTVLNLLGEVVMVKYFKEEQNLQFNFTNLSKGMYTLVFKSEDKKANYQIVKQ